VTSHGDFDALDEPCFYGVGGTIYDLRGEDGIVALKDAEDIISGLHLAGGTTDAKPQAAELLRAEMLDDALDTVLTSGAA